MIMKYMTKHNVKKNYRGCPSQQFYVEETQVYQQKKFIRSKIIQKARTIETWSICCADK